MHIYGNFDGPTSNKNIFIYEVTEMITLWANLQEIVYCIYLFFVKSYLNKVN